MTWNYRVVHEQGRFSIRAVYYNELNIPHSIAVSGWFPEAESLYELKEELQRVSAALNLPSLNADDFIT